MMSYNICVLNLAEIYVHIETYFVLFQHLYLISPLYTISTYVL